MSLSFEALREANVSRQHSVPKFRHSWSIAEWTKAVAGEVGEACNIAKKIIRGDDVTIEQLAHEIADVVIYADLALANCGVSLGEAVREKFNIVSVRHNTHERL